jgi:hypothetical protein
MVWEFPDALGAGMGISAPSADEVGSGSGTPRPSTIQRAVTGERDSTLKVRAALSDGKGSFLFDEIELGDPGPGEVKVT